MARPAPIPSPNRASSRQTRGVNHKALLKQVTDYLGTTRGWYAKLAGGAYQKPGLPDLIAAMPSLGFRDASYGPNPAQFVAIEIKTGTATLTPKQAEERARILDACGHYFVVHRIEDLEDQLLRAGLIEAPSLMRFEGTA